MPSHPAGVGMIGPHVLLPTDSALTYARVAGIVKAVNDPKPLMVAPESAIRIFRLTHGDGNDQLRFVPEVAVDQVTVVLKGYQHPRLLVELLNEVHGETARYVAWTRRAVGRAHELGYQVAGFSWATGDYQTEDWETARAAGWAGVDALAVHGYWGLSPNPRDPGAVLTSWNALRFRSFWRPGDPPIVITECGRDRVRDGDPGVDGGYVGAGWRQQGIADSQYLAEISAFDRAISRSPYVLGATVFTFGATPGWQDYDADSLVPVLAERVSQAPATPGSLQPVQEDQGTAPGRMGVNYQVGQGFARAEPLIGPWRESEQYHAPGMAHETSLAIGERGYAVWRRRTNETIAVTDSGQLWSDQGNRGDGVLRRLR